MTFLVTSPVSQGPCTRSEAPVQRSPDRCVVLLSVTDDQSGPGLQRGGEADKIVFQSGPCILYIHGIF